MHESGTAWASAVGQRCHAFRRRNRSRSRAKRARERCRCGGRRCRAKRARDRSRSHRPHAHRRLLLRDVAVTSCQLFLQLLSCKPLSEFESNARNA
uniref:Uncharacterized protein n=1 Tax=Oryza punctata TaxID=4537 RepID=A0A0E0MI64_ORYPU